MTTPFDMPPPTPVDGCAQCSEFVDQRRAARAENDRSGETDVYVLLRRHLRQDRPE